MGNHLQRLRCPDKIRINVLNEFFKNNIITCSLFLLRGLQWSDR